MNLKTLRLCVSAVSILFAFAIPVSAETFSVDEATAPIRVDGHLEDWPDARMFLLNQSTQITTGKNFWVDENDFSGRIFLTYDSLYLYVAALVQKKGGVFNDGRELDLWNGDCLEIFLSTTPKDKHPKRMSAGDFHLGLSPGTDCKNPQIYCFNKNKTISGARLISRKTAKGYLLEGAIPLTFFSGLEMGPGKTSGFNIALDEGGSIGGNLLVRMVYSGDSFRRENPASWDEIQWTGKMEVSIPTRDTEENFVGQVDDGTKGATYLGVKTIKGSVVDDKGAPLADTRVSTWPRTKEVITDAKGQFEFQRIKVYDKTLFAARKEGFGSALTALPSKGELANLRLTPLPPAFLSTDTDPPNLLFGFVVRLVPGQEPGEVFRKEMEWVKTLRPRILKLSGLASLGKTLEEEHQTLDQFISFARAVGAEPMMELPVMGDAQAKARDWVRYCNLLKNEKVRFWCVGNEPDNPRPRGADSVPEGYSVHDSINSFRAIANLAKLLDSSIFILGPELAWKYAEGEENWVTPFTRYNGDIVDMVSFHRYAAVSQEKATVKNIQDDARAETSLLYRIREKLSSNSELLIPLAMTGAALFPAGADDKTRSENQLDGFWPAVWTAESIGTGLTESLGVNLVASWGGGGEFELFGPTGDPGPVYWAVKMLGGLMEGKKIPVKIKQSGFSVYAVQDPGTRDLTLVLINKTDKYYRPKTLLNGKDADLALEAGLDQRIDYEIPSYSISCLKIKADRSPGEVTLYTQKMILEGKVPATSVLKPW